MNEFERPLASESGRSLRAESEVLIPACDVVENENHYMLSFDMPGIQKDDIEIELIGTQLEISGERKKCEEQSTSGFFRTERSFGRFRRSFTVPEGVNADHIQANYEDGVLTVTVPKPEERKAKKITIGQGGKGFLKKLTNKSEVKSAINS
jgi:HSP20 family protein